MAAPTQQTQPAPRVWTHARMCWFAATVFFSLSALCFAFSSVRQGIGPGLAWLAAGFAASSLAGWIP